MKGIQGVAGDCVAISSLFEEEVPQEDISRVEGEISELDTNDGVVQQAKAEYLNELDTYQGRFNVRATLLSGFENGPLSEHTDWKFWEVFPFIEHDAGPADLFLWESEQYGVLLVMSLVLSEQAKDRYDSTVELVNHAINEQTAIAAEKGIPEIDDDGITGVIAISQTDPSHAINNFDASYDDPEISIWKLESGENERLSLIMDKNTNNDGWRWDSPTGPLKQILTDGFEIAERRHQEHSPFYDSHHEHLLWKLPTFVHKENADRDAPQGYFSQDDLVDMLRSTRGAPRQRELSKRAESLLHLWTHTQAISPAPSPDEHPDDPDEEKVYKIGVDVTQTKKGVVEPYHDSIAMAMVKESKQKDILRENGVDIEDSL